MNGRWSFVEGSGAFQDLFCAVMPANLYESLSLIKSCREVVLNTMAAVIPLFCEAERPVIQNHYFRPRNIRADVSAAGSSLNVHETVLFHSSYMPVDMSELNLTTDYIGSETVCDIWTGSLCAEIFCLWYKWRIQTLVRWLLNIYDWVSKFLS